MIRRMLLRGASCMPTLRLLVTTVSRRRLGDRTGHREGGGAAGEADEASRRDEVGRRLGDPPLLRGMLRGALADRLLDEPADAADPSPRTRDRALPLE